MKQSLPTALPIIALLASLLTGCAGEPLREGVAAPDRVAEHPSAHLGQPQEWAGVVVRIENREEETLLEVLSYPVTRSGRPGTGQPPNGRFIALNPGYLEPLDFAPGRRVTVRGVLKEVMPGRVGEREYDLPVLEMTGITLWSPSVDEPRFRIGIGVGVGF